MHAADNIWGPFHHVLLRLRASCSFSVLLLLQVIVRRLIFTYHLITCSSSASYGGGAGVRYWTRERGTTAAAQEK